MSLIRYHVTTPTGRTYTTYARNPEEIQQNHPGTALTIRPVGTHPEKAK